MYFDSELRARHFFDSQLHSALFSRYHHWCWGVPFLASRSRESWHSSELKGPLRVAESVSEGSNPVVPICANLVIPSYLLPSTKCHACNRSSCVFASDLGKFLKSRCLRWCSRKPCKIGPVFSVSQWPWNPHETPCQSSHRSSWALSPVATRHEPREVHSKCPCIPSCNKKIHQKTIHPCSLGVQRSSLWCKRILPVLANMGKQLRGVWYLIHFDTMCTLCLLDPILRWSKQRRHEVVSGGSRSWL